MFSNFTCGCLPTNARSTAIRKAHAAEEKPIDLLWENLGDMPVIAWDSAFETWLDKRGDESDELRERGICTLPWVVLKALPNEQKTADVIAISQQQTNACAFYGDSAGINSTVLSMIAHGAPLVYRPANPFVGYTLSKPGNYGGRTISETAEYSNKNGHYPIDCVGDEQIVPDNVEEFADEAKTCQLAFAYVPGSGDELVRNIFRCCRADLAVSFGNTDGVTGVKIDKNGVKCAVVRGGWGGGHATCVTNYRRIGSTEYLWWWNSWGKRYPGSTEGDPDEGAYMDGESFTRFADSLLYFDRPYVHIGEGKIRRDWALRNRLALCFPDGFKR